MKRHKKKKSTPRTRQRHTLLWIVFLEVAVLAVGLIFILLPRQDEQMETLLDQEVGIDYIEEPETTAVPRPDIDEQLLTINDYSRPGTKTDGVKYIVVHYLANPMTTAQQNHDYFESLKDLQDTSMSANYIVGLEGEIIQCVPDDEIAYASNSANCESISVENCHKDDSGKFTADTYDSLVHLVAYLTELHGLGREDIIRHYDVTEKLCPKYYVEHEDKWEEFKDDVMEYRAECEAKIREKKKSEETIVDELAVFLESAAERESE